MRHRPKKENYASGIYGDMHYLERLERYCAYLENKSKLLVKQHATHSVNKPVASVNILDSDIATIEALHDLLLDAHGYSLDFITLKRARELTLKMYEAFDQKHKTQDK